MTEDVQDHELEAAAWLAASMGSNDPLYDKELRVTAKIVQGVANRVTSVRIVDGSHLEVRTTNPRNRTELTLTAQAMGHLFEAPVVREDIRDPSNSPAVSYAQPKRHYHYKDDRPERPPVVVEYKNRGKGHRRGKT